jgi:hypothetical protein
MAELDYNDTLGGLVRGILTDVRQLLREEIALARVEVREQAGRAKIAAASLGAAVVALAFGATFLLIAIAAGIADVFGWPLWAGFLTVALLLSVAGVTMYAVGRRRLRTIQPLPEQTVQTLKENSEWIAKRLSSARK